MQKGPMPIYAHQRVIGNLEERFGYIFEKENRYPGAPSVITHEIRNDAPFEIGNKTCIPVEAWHGGLQVFGFRVDDFAYLTDVKTIASEEIERTEGFGHQCLEGRRARKSFHFARSARFHKFGRSGKGVSYSYFAYFRISRRSRKTIAKWRVFGL